MDVNDLNLVNIRQLPHSLQALIDCVGLEHAYRLTCEFGGRPKYIPKHAERTSLSQILPPEALGAMEAYRDGTSQNNTLHVPTAAMRNGDFSNFPVWAN